MLYKSVSIKQPIARLIRNMKLQDSSYADDLIEWVAEALDKMQTKYQLTKHFESFNVTNHQVKMPCGLVDITAIKYKGQRLHYGSTAVNLKKIPKVTLNHDTGYVFQTDPSITFEGSIQDQEATRISGADLVQLSGDCSSEYYTINLDYIQTSFCEGCITLYYTKRPVDDDGYPLIPDNDNYLTAIYWYLRTMLIGAGYQDPTGFTYDYLNLQWETYARRAINEVKYPSEEGYEKLLRSAINLIPHQHYYGDFWVNAEQYKGTGWV